MIDAGINRLIIVVHAVIPSELFIGPLGRICLIGPIVGATRLMPAGL